MLRIAFLASAFALSSVSLAVAANEVRNGGFENPNNPMARWTELENPANGDVVAGANTNFYRITGSTGTIANVWTTIVQQVNDLTLGQDYFFSFRYRIAGNQFQTVNAAPAFGFGYLVDGQSGSAPLAVGMLNDGWQFFETTFTATQESILLALSGFARGGRTLDLDNVRIEAVPGPIAGAGLPVLLGFAGYAAWRRRRQAAG